MKLAATPGRPLRGMCSRHPGSKRTQSIIGDLLTQRWYTIPNELILWTNFRWISVGGWGQCGRPSEGSSTLLVLRVVQQPSHFQNATAEDMGLRQRYVSDQKFEYSEAVFLMLDGGFSMDQLGWQRLNADDKKDELEAGKRTTSL